MKHKWFNKALSAVLALVMCIGMLPAVATPAAADEVQPVALGNNEWVVKNDDFSRYPVGEDTFWKNAWYSGFSGSHHGIVGSDTYAAYGIVEENGNKMLELVSMNTTPNYFTVPAVSGAHSLSFDFLMKKSASSVPGLAISFFIGVSPSLPGGATVYVEPYGTRLVEYISTGAKVETFVKDANGSPNIPYDTWYTLKLSVEPGKFIVKSWPTGQAEPADDATAGVIVLEHECFTQERVNSSLESVIQNRCRNYAGVTQTTRIDNLKITKPYDTITLPTALQGASGERIGISATFSGQDLYAQVPAPQFNYTLSDPKLGHVAPDGYLILGEAGQGTVTVEAADMDGKGSGTTWTIPLTVTAATQSAQPLRILSIGNGYSRDTLYYLSHLAKLVGQKVEFGYLYQKDATLRYHAHNVAMKTADYSYYVSNPDTGVVTQAAAVSTINEVVNSQNWDIVMLHQGVDASGMNNTLAGDLRYLLDYLADAQPNAKVYWNMNTATQQSALNSDDSNYYDSNQAVMYNAIVDSLEWAVVGEKARYADDFDGWFPVGATIQNLRATSMGDNLTRDGDQLSLQAGRLAAAMTVLKVLFPSADLSKITPDAVSAFLITDKIDNGTTFANDPSYTNDAANMALIRQSVEAACANLSKAPAKLATNIPTVESLTKDPNDITVGQTDAPLALRFADIVVTKDGTVYAGAYESVTHVPARGKLPYTEYCPEGYGRLKIWKSIDNGKTWDFDNPILTIDQQELQDWGISPNLYNRYELLKTGVQDYAFLNDARDANLGLMYYDMDGNGTEDEVLMFTFFCNDYNESGSSTFTGTHLLFSIDGGKTWSKPQRIMSSLFGNGGGKRGDIAVFSDGQILFPMYSNPRVCGVLLQWNVKTQHWDTIAESEIDMYIETTEFTEPSFIAPDPDGNTVYGFVRDNGQAVISYDRGRTWEWIHTIDGNVQQPGWAYIDEDHAFATWSFSGGGTRPTKGQMVYFDAGWEATQPVVIDPHYEAPGRDTGDPSAKLLANGKILAITYDTYFRAINGKFIDPNAPEFLLAEMNEDAAEVVLEEVTPTSADLTVGGSLPAAHTVSFTATFNAGGNLTVTAANGAMLEFGPNKYGIRANKETEVRVMVTNGATYVKVWAVGTAEPEDWTVVKGGTATNSGKVTFAGSGVTLGTVKATRKVTMIMGEGGRATTGMLIKLPLWTNPTEMLDEAVWTTSNPDVAVLDGQGTAKFVGKGSVTFTATLGDKSLSVSYTVTAAAGEIMGEGETVVLFEDDFEGYTAGDNAFYKAMSDNGYTKVSGYATTGYNILEEDGNQYLELVSKEGKEYYPWLIVDTPLAGDYTAQFDFCYDAKDYDGSIFLNMWTGNSLYAMVQMGGEDFNYQHEEGGIKANYRNSERFYAYTPGQWTTMKVARVNGGLYAKAWPQGTPEPSGWQYCYLQDELNTGNVVKFRLSFSVQEENEQHAYFDNLKITKQRTSVGETEWVARNDTFEDRTVGTDKFWEDSKYTGFTNNSTYRKLTEGGFFGWGGTSYYSRYNIIQESGNKMVELLSTYKVANYFKTTKVTGSYSTTLDLYMPKSTGSSVPGVVMNLFDGASGLPGSIQVYIDGNDGVRLVGDPVNERHGNIPGAVYNTEIKDGAYLPNEAGTKAQFKLDTWYTVKMSVEPGRLIVKFWLRGDNEPANDSKSGVLVFEHDSITENVLYSGVAFSLQTRSRGEKNVNYIVRLDNLKIAKPYRDLLLPDAVSGEPGETVEIKPVFTGQNLTGLLPAARIRYTVSNPFLATVNADGVVTLNQEGTGTISVELLDVDGYSGGVVGEIELKVAKNVAPDPDPDPENPNPDPEPETPASTLGYFGLQVIKTITVNGEKVDICRWVWTPFNQ